MARFSSGREMGGERVGIVTVWCGVCVASFSIQRGRGGYPVPWRHGTNKKVLYLLEALVNGCGLLLKLYTCFCSEIFVC